MPLKGSPKVPQESQKADLSHPKAPRAPKQSPKMSHASKRILKVLGKTSQSLPGNSFKTIKEVQVFFHFFNGLTFTAVVMKNMLLVSNFFNF